MVLVQIGAEVYYALLLAAAILDFVQTGLYIQGVLNLLAMVFENLVSIAITMQNFKNLSQSARFSQIAFPLQSLHSSRLRRGQGVRVWCSA